MYIMDRLHASPPEILDQYEYEPHGPALAPGNFAGKAVFQLMQERHRNERLEELAMRDPLTGLGNSRALEIEFNTLVQSSPVNRSEDPKGPAVFKPHSLVVLDIDHFKTFNDTYGHQHGDKALRDFAKLLRKDAYRLSGRADEFAILLPFTPEEDAVEIAQNILERENAAGLKASIGVAEINALESLKSNMHRADEAMYAAKKERNKVVPHSLLEGSRLKTSSEI